MLASIEDYQLETADVTSGKLEVEQALANAQSDLEEALGRVGLLELGEKTETLPVSGAYATQFGGQDLLFPTAIPIVQTILGVADVCGLRCISDVLYGPTPDSSPDTPGAWPRWEPLVATVTYRGGFDPDETDRNSRFFVPRCIVADLCENAYQRLHPTSRTRAPIGATSVRSGGRSRNLRDRRSFDGDAVSVVASDDALQGGPVTVALATTAVTIETATEDEPGEGRTFTVLRAHVPAQIGSPAGVEDDSPGGGQQTLSAVMDCDPVTGLDHTCRVTDEITGEVWEVQWVKLRTLIPHMKAGLRRWEGGGR